MSRTLTPLSRRPLRMPNTSCTIRGDRPIDGSSISRSLGSSRRLRATSRIFCWPPDSAEFESVRDAELGEYVAALRHVSDAGVEQGARIEIGDVAAAERDRAG